MLKMNIADIKINVIPDNIDELLNNSDLFSRFAPFAASYNEAADIELSISSCEKINTPFGKLLIDEGMKWVSRNDSRYKYSIFYCKMDSNEPVALLDATSSWNNAAINYIKSNYFSDHSLIISLAEILFRTSLLLHRGIVIHASAISWQNKGILFAAPSETGKTTQANLWRKHMGAKILNGDRPAVRVIENEAFVFGTPWSGKDFDFSSNSSPLSAIVVLEQSQVNSIHILKPSEILQLLLPRCFLPYFDDTLMKAALSNIEKIISLTPVYLLKCRPDREAVELVYECIR